MNSVENQAVRNNNPITLKDIILIVWARKWFLVLTAIIGLILTTGLGMVYNYFTSEVATIVEFQWNGISKGEYPDQTRFDYTNLFESYILADSIAELSLEGISSSDLKSGITVTPIVPSSVYDLIEAELLKGNQLSYFPNVFRISIKPTALGMKELQAEQLLSYLIDEYRVDFEKKYIQRSVVIDYTDVSLTAVDYIEAHEILASQITLIENSVGYVLEDSTTFVSTQLGIGFSEILVRTDLVTNINLDSISARINNYLLTKDKTLLITRYSYAIEQLELALTKYIKIETGLQTLIDNYVGSTTTIIIPGLENTVIDTESYLKTLYSTLVSTKSDIAETEEEISYYQVRIDRLEGNDPAFIVTPEQVVIETAKVEASLIVSTEIISDIVSDLEIMFAEYNTFVTRSTINPLMTPQYIPNVQVMMLAAGGLVFGFSVGLAIVFILFQKKETK